MIIIHGENQVMSRAAFLEAKKGGIELLGDELTLDQLVQLTESQDLFGNVNKVAIEGFFSRRPSNEKKKIIVYLENHQDAEIVMWDGKDITAQVKEFKNTKKFDLPKTIWKYLDTFSLNDLKPTLENTAPELVFSLVAGQVRKLIQVKHNSLDAPAWQLAKLKNQTSKFSPDKLLQMHSDLLKIDYKTKTSGSALGLAGHLELWTLKLG